MGKQLRSLSVIVFATLVTLVAVGNATANTITAEPGGNITATSLGRLSFNGRGGIEIAINCRATLRGRVNTTINNTAGSSFGTLVEGNANECNAGSMQFRFETAWTMTINETINLGRSPKTLNININRARIRIEQAGIACGYEGNILTTLEAESNIFGTVTTRLLRTQFNTQRRIEGVILCPTEVHSEGTFEIPTQTLRL